MSFPSASLACSPPPPPPPEPIEPPILLQSERHKTYYESTRLARRRYEHATLREGLQRGLSLWSILAILSSGGHEDVPYRGRRVHPSRLISYSHGPRLEDRSTSMGCESTAMHYAHAHIYDEPPLEQHEQRPTMMMLSSSYPQSQPPIHHRNTSEYYGSSSSSSSSSSTTPSPPRLPQHNHHHHQSQIYDPNHQHTPINNTHHHHYHHHPSQKINPLLTLTINPPLITPDSSYFARVSDYRVRSRKRPWEGDRSWDRSFLCRAYKRRRGGGGGETLGIGSDGRRVRGCGGGGAVVLERGMVWEMGGCGSDIQGEGGRDYWEGDGDGGRWRYWVPV